MGRCAGPPVPLTFQVWLLKTMLLDTGFTSFPAVSFPAFSTPVPKAGLVDAGLRGQAVRVDWGTPPVSRSGQEPLPRPGEVVGSRRWGFVQPFRSAGNFPKLSPRTSPHTPRRQRFRALFHGVALGAGELAFKEVAV